MMNKLDVTAMRNRTTLLRAEYSTAQHRLTAPFLRPAGRLKLNIPFVMDNRRILMGLLYPVWFGGLFHIKDYFPGGNL